MSEPILSVSGLGVSYHASARVPWRRAASLPAVEDVTFSVGKGEVVALVGESGSGKSSIGNAIMGLAPATSGSIQFQRRDIANASLKERRAVASDLQMIFQNPFGSLNPSLTIEAILTEPLRVNAGVSHAEARSIVREALDKVGLPKDAAARRPPSFSGGQRQRIAIARALTVSPKLIVCDEPTSALDVSTQRTVLDLLANLRDEIGVAYLFITHDLAVVRQFADRVLVLNRGRIIETGSPADICETPSDPYTQRLVAAAPVPDPLVQARRRQVRLDHVRTTKERPLQ